jgi:hypothetical protein
LRQADVCKRRHGKDARGNARVIWRVLRALDYVAADNPSLVSRDRGKLRGRGDCVTANKCRRVRRRAQVRIERDPPVFRRDIAGRKLEAIDVGDPPGAVDYSVRLDRVPRATAALAVFLLWSRGRRME